jgi:hypothetical protein
MNSKCRLNFLACAYVSTVLLCIVQTCRYFCAVPVCAGNPASLAEYRKREVANPAAEDRWQSERPRWVRLHSNPAPHWRRHCTRDWRGIRSRCPTPWPGTAGKLRSCSCSSRDNLRLGDKTDIAQCPARTRSLKIKSRQLRTTSSSSFSPIFRPGSSSRLADHLERNH